MTGAIETKLAEIGLELPAVAAPAGSYVGYVISGNLIFVSGQGPFWNDELQYKGKVGVDYGVEEGQEAAKICALNIIAQVKVALDGDLDRVTRIVKLEGFVNCPADFEAHPAVINGASDLMGEVFGEKSRHARFAIGASSLPFNIAVEVVAVVEFS